MDVHDAYRTELLSYAVATWMKALRYANEGLHLATRLGLAPTLQQALTDLKRSIERNIETNEIK